MTSAQQSDGQWTVGARHLLPGRAVDVTDLALNRLHLGCAPSSTVAKQHARTSLMIQDIGAIAEWISAIMTFAAR